MLQNPIIPISIRMFVAGVFALVSTGPSVTPVTVAINTRSTANVGTTSAPYTIDFETLSDFTPVTNQYSYLGVSFSGATILSQGESLNYTEFPPRSGRNVIYDDPAAGGVITITFDPAIVGNVTQVGGYITGNTVITMLAYDSSANSLGSVSTSGANYVGGGTPNQQLEIDSNTPIAQVVFHDSGNSFTIDDFYFNSQQGCQVINVPLYKQYKQTDEQWADDNYGGTTSNPWPDPNHPGQNAKMKDYGCATTSAAMVISYYGLQQTGRTTNPGELNNWLKANNGYSGGNVNWFSVAEFARDGVGTSVVKGQGVAPQFYYYAGVGPDNGIVNGFLCNSAPMILNTTTAPYSGHYLVATGQAGSNAWKVNDPGQYNLPQLSITSYKGYRKYSSSPRDPTGIYIAVHSPVELLITDPSGQKTGFDPSTGNFVNGIIDAEYEIETLGDSSGSFPAIQTRIFEVGTPISGDYSIEIIGIGNGPYTIDFSGFTSDGSQSQTSIHNYISNSTNITETLSYSTEPGSQITVTQPPTLIYLPLITK